MIIQPIISKIDTTSNWKTFNPIPRSGEQCIEDLGKGLFKLKIGDGVTPWISLKYATTLPRDLVESVNGKTGFVTLTAVDVGAQPTLPDGEEGQALFKINGGVEWKDIITEVSHDNSLSGTGTVEDPLKLSEEVNNRLDSFATQEEVNKKQDILTAGDGIEIKDGVISNTKVSAEWGKIEGSLDNQTDLKDALDLKANKSDLIKDVQNISSIDIYNDVSELPTLNAGLNGTRYLALTNGKLPLKIYTWDNPTQTWELIDSTRGSSLYINIQTGLVYYYRSSQPYLRPVNDKAEWGKITGFIDDQTDLKNLLDSKVNKVNDKSIVYGTDIDGNQTTYSKEDFGKVDDVQVRVNNSSDFASVVDNKIAKIDLSSINKDIEDIQEVIPTQATKENQLADKSFVNSSIATSTADFIGTFDSLEELQNYSGVITNNDYAFVVAKDDVGNLLYNRYKYTDATTPASWKFEYTLNNSAFTANQWASINSGSTDVLIKQITTNKTNIDNHVTNKSNPHEVTKAQIGLGNVDNTSDLNKPISTATQEALNLKANTSYVQNAVENINDEINELKTTIENFDALPDQTNKNGSILTTDGISASWTLDYVKPTDYATSTKTGLIKPSNNGLSVDTSGTLSIVGATISQVEAKTSADIALTPANIDQIVKTGLTTNTLTLSDEDRLKLQDWLGIGTLIMRNWK